MAWQRFRVELVDREPIEVQTNARDFAGVRLDPEGGGLNAVGITFQVVHAALVRQRVEGVPRAYSDFLDVLDAMPEALDEEEDADPTHAAVTDSPP